MKIVHVFFAIIVLGTLTIEKSSAQTARTSVAAIALQESVTPSDAAGRNAAANEPAQISQRQLAQLRPDRAKCKPNYKFFKLGHASRCEVNTDCCSGFCRPQRESCKGMRVGSPAFNTCLGKTVLLRACVSAKTAKKTDAFNKKYLPKILYERYLKTIQPN